MSVAEPLLTVQDLEVQFKTDEGIVRAVNGISYEVKAGASVGLVGESGCGKSVSSLALMRLIPQPAGRIVNGRIRFQGNDMLALSQAEMREIRGKHIAMIFQDPMNSLNPVLTIGRQIDEAQTLHLGVNAKEARRRTIDLLDIVGIPSPADRANDYPHQLSGGMQQRAMIAMAISCQPALLIADEPSTALDVTIQAQVIELLARLRRDLKMAVILITHDLALVAGFCEQVMVMYAGYVVESAPAREVFRNPRHPYTLGLMGSIPKITGDRRARLTAIPGAPPNMVHLPPGCPFAARCPFVLEECRAALPALASVGLNHLARCIVDVKTGKPR
ncbi:MAG: ABC transporter ATP-binding protein [Actinobacteria bacterium]|nr:ABC transporter ATP-binding protein [Actinomycetota bacterium]